MGVSRAGQRAGSGAGGGSLVSLWRRRWRRSPWSPVSLFWQVFAVNAILVVAAVLILALSPATVSFPAKTAQLAVLGVGLAVILVANAVLLRISLAPLRRLVQLMRKIDLLRPGQRLEVEGARELRTLVATFNQMLDRLELERRLSSTRTVSGQEEERRRIATELHDQVGQSLTALLLRLKNAVEDAPPELAPQLVEAQAIARQNLDEVGRIARRLRPTALDDLSLAYALHSLVDAFEGGADPEFEREIELELPRLTTEAELAVYRIAQEALTNAVRHANANRVTVALRREGPGAVQLRVCDDGRGMVHAADLEHGGIRGMRERAVSVGASLSIEAYPGGGTSVSLTVPVEP